MNRLLNTSSITGSALVPIAVRLGSASTRREHDVVPRRDLGLPARLDDDGLVRLDDQRRAGDHRAGPEAAREDGPPHRARRRRNRSASRSAGCGRGGDERRLGLLEVGAAADRLDLERFDDDRLVLEDEAELLAVRRLEGGDHRGRSRQRAPGLGQPRLEDADRKRRVGAVVAEVGADDDGDVGVGDALPPHFVDGGRLELALVAGEVEPVGDRLHHGAVAGGADVGEAHAVGRQHAGIGVDQHGPDAERVGDQAGMLAAGAAEAVERVFGHVVAALDRDLLDRVRHVLRRRCGGSRRRSPPGCGRRRSSSASAAKPARTASSSSGWSRVSARRCAGNIPAAACRP